MRGNQIIRSSEATRRPDDAGAGAAASLALLDALAGDGSAEARLRRALAAAESVWSRPCGVTLDEPVARDLGLSSPRVAAYDEGPAPEAATQVAERLIADGRRLGLLWAAGPAAPRGMRAVADRLARWLADARRVEVRHRELERSDGLKTVLLRGVSHEFRSPLTAIANAGAALGVVDDPDRRRDLLDGLMEECGRLERLVDNLLDLSRLEGDVLKPRLDWCSPEELVGGAVRAAGAVLADAVVETRLDPAVALVRADPVMTERILVNLLHNAVRHGRPPVLISCAVEGDALAIAVEDDGPGVDPDVLPRVFEPFVHRPDEGLGLGLPLCRRLARAQGGRLEHRPSPRGACFALLLPLADQPEVPA